MKKCISTSYDLCIVIDNPFIFIFNKQIRDKCPVSI